MQTSKGSARLQGKTAIVVGAGSIGAAPSNGSATALTFAREGAKVLCVDREAKNAQRTVEQIRELGGEAHAFVADVADAQSLKAMAREGMARLGRIDILHNNVGIEEFGELIEITEESWDRVFAINLKGVMIACREVVPLMIESGGGSIINVSSISSRRWSQYQFLSYNTSKAGLNHFTRVCARQYAKHKVRFNVVIPGLIDTPHAEALFKTPEEVKAAKLERVGRCPMGRQGTPQDIANAALFLASNEASYVSGLELVVDGAITC